MRFFFLVSRISNVFIFRVFLLSNSFPVSFFVKHFQTVSSTRFKIFTSSFPLKTFNFVKIFSSRTLQKKKFSISHVFNVLVKFLIIIRCIYLFKLHQVGKRVFLNGNILKKKETVGKTFFLSNYLRF